MLPAHIHGSIWRHIDDANIRNELLDCGELNRAQFRIAATKNNVKLCKMCDAVVDMGFRCGPCYESMKSSQLDYIRWAKTVDGREYMKETIHKMNDALLTVAEQITCTR